MRLFKTIDESDLVRLIRSRFYGKHAQPTTASIATLPSLPLDSHSNESTTLTLAQQLNQLAAANSEGLLSSDEYRLLRQNLFERFATRTAGLPMENPVIPLIRPSTTPSSYSPAAHHPQSPTFQPRPSRPPSVLSRTSISSTLLDFLRGPTHRTNHSTANETSSIFSTTSRSSFFFVRNVLTRKKSNSSIRTQSSRIPSDTNLTRQPHPPYPIMYPKPQADRPPPTPPSSFPSRCFPPDRITGLPDERNLSTTNQIREEILAVEAEAKRINAVFNDLQSPSPSDSDTISVRSGISLGPPSTSNRLVRAKSGTSSTSSSLRRSNSAFSVSSSAKNGLPPPRPSIGNPMTVPLSNGLPTTSHHPDGETTDIQRHRPHVISRYEARLDYLRAKLKSAELHEKLLKK